MKRFIFFMQKNNNLFSFWFWVKIGTSCQSLLRHSQSNFNTTDPTMVILVMGIMKALKGYLSPSSMDICLRFYCSSGSDSRMSGSTWNLSTGRTQRSAQSDLKGLPPTKASPGIVKSLHLSRVSWSNTGQHCSINRETTRSHLNNITNVRFLHALLHIFIICWI